MNPTGKQVNTLCLRLVDLGVISSLAWQHGRISIEEAIRQALIDTFRETPIRLKEIRG